MSSAVHSTENPTPRSRRDHLRAFIQLSHLPLATRLLLTLSALLFIGLLLSSTAAVAALRSYLLNQVDQHLSDAGTEVLRRASGSTDPFISSTGSISITDFFVEIREPDGTLDSRIQSYINADYRHTPNLNAAVAVRNAGKGAFTAGSVTDEDYRYRALVIQPTPSSQMLVLATPIASVSSVIDRLATIDALAIGIVMLTLLCTAYLLIRRDLAPLQGMTQTAGAIAAGDLTRRVDHADEHTEVGQLGTAFNAMLSQIEASFAERQATEDRLRRFAADASHELRTPLTAIRGYAELHRQGAIVGEDDTKRVMSRIESEATRMSTMVEDLLLLARLDQGRPLETTTLDLVTIATDAVSDARAIAPQRTIDIHVQGEPLLVDGEAGRLHQVIANLLSNALTHTQLEARIDVNLRRDGSWVELAVRDDGPGMDEDAAARIFERFYRVDTGRSRAQGGTGLGLAIVQALVAAHGGIVGVASHAGEGATFTVRLPAAPRDVQPLTPSELPAIEANSSP